MRGYADRRVVVLHVLLASSAFAEDFTGPVVGLIDGDSIRVMHEGRVEAIRLNGSDCPEQGQAYGQRAKHTAADLAFRKEVTVKTHGRDKYKRTLADVILPDGPNVNHTRVKDGWCWWYRKYAPSDAELERLETEARTQRREVWATESRCHLGNGEPSVGMQQK